MVMSQPTGGDERGSSPRWPRAVVARGLSVALACGAVAASVPLVTNHTWFPYRVIGVLAIATAGLVIIVASRDCSRRARIAYGAGCLAASVGLHFGVYFVATRTGGVAAWVSSALVLSGFGL